MQIPPIRFARTRDGVDISYISLPGEGAPFVACPGFVTPPLSVRLQIGSWWEFVEHYRRGRPLLTFDYRGAGLSGQVAESVSVDAVALDIQAVLEAAGEPVHLRADTPACAPAALVTSLHPELVRSLFLTGPGRGPPPMFPAAKPVSEPEWEQLRYHWLRAVFDFPPGDPGKHLATASAASVSMSTFARWWDLVREMEIDQYLARVRPPVLIWSTVAEAAVAHAIAANRPGTQIVIGEPMAYNAAFADALRDAFDQFWHEAGEEQALVKDLNGLSARELDVLRLLASGKTNIQIAEALVVSRATVATHVSHILQKTGSANRAEATAYAVRHGLA